MNHWTGSEPDPHRWDGPRPLCETCREYLEECECGKDEGPEPTDADRALAAAIVHHAYECFDRTRDGWHTVTVGFDVKKPNGPYNLERVAELVGETLGDCRVSAPWSVKGGIEIQTFEDEGPDLTWNLEE